MYLMNSLYQIITQKWKIPCEAVSSPSGLLREWQVMTHVISSDHVKFNGCFTNLLQSVREFTLRYFYDVFAQIRAINGRT